MKVKLIEQNTNNVIGEITLNHLPRKKESIEFNNKVYGIVNIVHSESEIKLKLFPLSIETEEIIVEWS